LGGGQNFVNGAVTYYFLAWNPNDKKSVPIIIPGWVPRVEYLEDPADPSSVISGSIAVIESNRAEFSCPTR